jgi:putative protease
VTEVTEDAFHVEVKNKLEPGDVLEIVSPVARNTVLLRAYEYEIAATGESREVVHGSTKTVVRFPFALFEHEETEDLRMNFPPFTVVRKERALTEEQWARLQLDKTALAMEVKDTTGETAYKRRRDALVEAIEADANTRRFKTNRVGTEGCCGKGCNGCLIFWQDDSYAKAREILLQRKQGAMLTKAEASALRIPAAD